MSVCFPLSSRHRQFLSRGPWLSSTIGGFVFWGNFSGRLDRHLAICYIPYMTDSELGRFLGKLEFDEALTWNGMPCWLWGARRTKPSGYGTLNIGGKHTRAHRLAYEHWIGPIPEGLQPDHLCRVRRCCNPWHVEPVTQSVNVLRSLTALGKQAKPKPVRTHCDCGREYEKIETRKGQMKVCRPCARRRGTNVVTGFTGW